MCRVLATILLLLAACGPSRAALRPGDAAKTGERFDLAARGLDGRTRTVGELTGGKIALVDVWATWCSPCGDALLAWERLADRLDGRLAVVAISIDEDQRQIPKFLARTPVSFPILWDRGGREAFSRLALEKVPTVLILDEEGRVRHVHEGFYGSHTVEAIEAEVAALLVRPEAAGPASNRPLAVRHVSPPIRVAPEAPREYRCAMSAKTPDLLLDTAITAARAAGAVLAERFGGERTVERKGAIDLVTDADRAAEEVALGAIRARFPDHELLAEETGAAGHSPYRWIVDPLDGTVNYAHGIPQFCVSIACEAQGRLVAGAVFDPIRGELFTASRGGGAFLNGRRLAVTRVDDVNDALLATGFPYWVHEKPELVVPLFDAFLRRAQGLRRFGSAALDLAWVAAGRFDGFFERGLKPWDMAAGLLLVEEAGGTVSDLDGGPVSYERGELIAAGAAIHPKLLTIAGAGRS